MNAFARHTQTPDDARAWSPSLVDAVRTGLPRQDPVALLLAEQKRDGAMLRLLLSAAAATLLLALGGTLLS
jgi:hypothetical protein